MLTTIKVIFRFLKYVLACKNSAKFIHSFRNQSPMPISDHNHSKIIKVILNFFLNLHLHAKNQLSSSIHASIHLVTKWPQPFLIIPTAIFFYQLLKNTKVDYFINLF